MKLPRLSRNDLRVLRLLWPEGASIAYGRGFMLELEIRGVLDVNRNGRYVIAPAARAALIERKEQNGRK